MSLLLTVPTDRLAPLMWVADIVFPRMLGIQVAVQGGGPDTVTLSGHGATLAMPSLFPVMKGAAVDRTAALPKVPIDQWHLGAAGLDADIEGSLPVLFGQPELTFDKARAECGIDIFGTIFFMLSRFEEIARPDRDQHDRFPATASLAHAAGFLQRPIVDEYVEVLWAIMKRLWPGLERKRRQGRVAVSCDVDRPFDHDFATPALFARSLAADLLVRRDAGRAIRRIRNAIDGRNGDYSRDPLHTFDWYMDVCERLGHQAAFYFIADHPAGVVDCTYDLAEPRVQALMRKLADRGHELGMHGSYTTYRNAPQIGRERERLFDACKTAGIKAKIAGNRQHYLRWSSAETQDHLETAGFEYDTSGSFADQPGFRYGTAHPFPMWSWRKEAPLKLVQRPLVLMECSVIAQDYLGMGYSGEALDLMKVLKRRALRHGGDFSLLWHNSFFLTKGDRLFFEELLA